MDMRVMHQGLAPRVQNGQPADLRAEPARIGGQNGHGLEGGLEQDRVDDGLVLEGNGPDGWGQREHDMEIGNRQQLGLPVGEPGLSRRRLTLWTMPIAAGVVGDAAGATIVACLDMAAERRCSTGNDGAHDAPLAASDMSSTGAQIGLAMTTQDVRDLGTSALRSFAKRR